MNMPKQITVSFTTEALEVITKYTALKGCSRNKAINDLVIAKKTTTEEKLMKMLLKKIDEVKAILTKESEE